MPSPPRRRFELKIKLTGDTYEDLCVALRSLYLELDDESMGEKPYIDIAVGAERMSYVVHGVQDPEMTHERYYQDLRAYLVAVDRERQAQKVAQRQLEAR